MYFRPTLSAVHKDNDHRKKWMSYGTVLELVCLDSGYLVKR
jgi:hypothetical protein